MTASQPAVKYSPIPASICKCSAIVGHSGSNAGITDAIYCPRPATRATLCNPTRPEDTRYRLINIGHFFCNEHAPEAYAVTYPLPENYPANY